MKHRKTLVEEQEPYLRALFAAVGVPSRRRKLLQYGSGDQINAVSELVLNTLKDRIPLPPPLMARLRRYKGTLREVGRRKNSIKKRREQLLRQGGRGFWSGLDDVCRCAFKKWRK